jgi:acylphosphatase
MHVWHVTLHGRVQGVGYRAFVARRARELGVRGEVRNTGDGAVEIVAESDEGTLEAFLAEVRLGPPAARVEHVEVMRSETAARYRGFTVTG